MVPAALNRSLRFIAAVGPHFRRPDRLEIPVRPIIPAHRFGEPPDSLQFDLGGPLLLPLAPDGLLNGRQPVAASAVPAVNAALVAAVLRRDSAGPLDVKEWAALSAAGPVQLQVGIGVEAPPGSLPLMRTAIPIFKADTEVTALRFAKPQYPTGSQMRGEAAHVDVRYVVREDGRADPSSIEVLSVEVDAKSSVDTAAEAFAKSAVKAIGDSRFNPARVRGCPVRATVAQRISFKIGF